MPFRFALAAERLPGWTIDLLGDDPETPASAWRSGASSTFIVRNPETGRS